MLFLVLLHGRELAVCLDYRRKWFRRSQGPQNFCVHIAKLKLFLQPIEYLPRSALVTVASGVPGCGEGLCEFPASIVFFVSVGYSADEGETNGVEGTQGLTIVCDARNAEIVLDELPVVHVASFQYALYEKGGILVKVGIFLIDVPEKCWRKLVDAFLCRHGVFFRKRR